MDFKAEKYDPLELKRAAHIQPTNSGIPECGYVLLYHGTRACLESIRQHGLQPHGLDGDKTATIDRALAEFGLTRVTALKWTWRHELAYEAGYQNHTHLCLNPNIAEGYAFMGGEPAFCVRKNVLTWRNIKRFAALRRWHGWKGEGPLHRKLNLQAAEANGSMARILEIKINWGDPFVEDWEAIRLARAYEQEWFSAYEVRYFGVIPWDHISVYKEFPIGWGGNRGQGASDAAA